MAILSVWEAVFETFEGRLSLRLFLSQVLDWFGVELGGFPLEASRLKLQFTPVSVPLTTPWG